MTKSKLLLKYIIENEPIRTSAIMLWGVKHYFNTAARQARRFCEQDLLKRMPKEEKEKRYGKTREDVYIMPKSVKKRLIMQFQLDTHYKGI